MSRVSGFPGCCAAVILHDFLLDDACDAWDKESVAELKEKISADLDYKLKPYHASKLILAIVDNSQQEITKKLLLKRGFTVVSQCYGNHINKFDKYKLSLMVWSPTRTHRKPVAKKGKNNAS